MTILRPLVASGCRISSPPDLPKGPGGVIFSGRVPAERVRAGSRYPNYDVQGLARRLCDDRAWRLVQARFYTGVPSRADNLAWHQFWEAKLRAISRQGLQVYSRALRFHTRTVRLPDGTAHLLRAGEEKGIDVRIALGLVLSQDQDLSEAADEIRLIAREQNR